jgi:hypothetical protein
MAQLRYIIFLFIVIAGCSTTPLTEADAVRIASRTMERHGQRLSEFRPPDVMTTTNGFAVFFLPHVRVPGGDFMVIVDGKTRRAEFVRGE